MIHFAKSKISQVEYLIAQSMQGHHILFDTATLRRVFRGSPQANAEPTEEEAYAVEPILERLIQEPSIASKKAYLDCLDRETLDKVVRTYFSIVEHNLFEKTEVPH